MPGPKPIAFMSYVHFDDAHDNGKLTQFRERLSGELTMQTGDEFPIFQDRNDINWGQNWKERIEDSIDGATFFLPIITPSFFKSAACRDELERFLKREKKLKRSDLILPVYYVDCPVMNDEASRQKDELAEAIAKHQYVDWRDLRFEPLTSADVCRRIARLAEQIRDALGREGEGAKATAKVKTAKRKLAGKSPRTGKRTVSALSDAVASISESTGELRKTEQGPSPKTEPPTLIVDAMHRGHHPTITEAINAADPGTRILVRPGLYREGLIIDKPLEIIGDGPPGDVVVQAEGADVILFQANMGRVANLVLRQMGGGDWYGVDITQGRLDLEDCDIVSQGSSCVAIHGGADPRLRRNRIHDGESAGVHIYDNAQGTLEDNDIFGNALAGVEISNGSNPILRRNRIHDGRAGGVLICANGQGTLEDNDIFGNASAGVTILTGSNPILCRNRIHDGKTSGVFIYENGRGTFEENNIFGNAFSGVEIKTSANPTLRRNRIHDGKQNGVFIYENGQGTLEDNDIFANGYSGVFIQSGNPALRHNRINKNGYEGVWIYEEGAGVIEDNDLRDNARGAWDISADSEPNVKRQRNLE